MRWLIAKIADIDCSLRPKLAPIHRMIWGLETRTVSQRVVQPQINMICSTNVDIP